MDASDSWDESKFDVLSSAATVSLKNDINEKWIHLDTNAGPSEPLFRQSVLFDSLLKEYFNFENFLISSPVKLK